MEKPRDFASLLDDLFDVPPAADEPAARPNIPFDYLTVADELHSGRIRVSGGEAASQYREASSSVAAELAEILAPFDVEQGSDSASDAAPPEQPLPSIEPDAIAAELGLDRTAGKKDLGRMRREFAFRNHPDRVAPHLRQRALIRMQVANMLIDDARRLSGNPRR